MVKSMRWIATCGFGVAFSISLASQTELSAQSYAIRPKCDCNQSGKCSPNPGTWGFNDPSWRQFPQPRPDQRFSSSVGSEPIPAPPGEVPKPLPRAPIVPSKPSIDDSHPDSALPVPKESGGDTSPTRSQLDINRGLTPKTDNPERDKGVLPNAEKPGPMALPGLGGPDQPSLPALDKPKSDKGGSLPSTTDPLAPVFQDAEPSKVEKSKENVKPSDNLQYPSDSALPKPSASPGSDTLVPKKSATSPAEDTPALPKIERQSYAQPVMDDRRLDRMRASTTTEKENSNIASQGDSIVRADWGTSLAPESYVTASPLVENVVEQKTMPASEVSRLALDGYCPVELHNRDRWVAGSVENKVEFEGRTYAFASAANAEQFVQSPDRFAPAFGGIDPVVATEEGREVVGTVDHSAVWNKRLYLFSTSASLTSFQEDPSRYARRERGIVHP